MEPMTGVNSPFTQDELNHAVALMTEAGFSREWAEDYLAQCWSRSGFHPTSAAQAAVTALRAKWPALERLESDYS